MMSGRKMLLWHLYDKKALGCPLFILLLLCNTPEGDGYFLGGSKAVFPSGCSQTWTIAEDVHVPQLTQLTVCVDIRLRASGDWTAFTYSTTQSQSQDLAITGDKKNVYVWLLGVQFPFPVNLSLNNWYHVCLKLNGQKQSISLDINGSPSVLKVNTTVVPPGGALVLGCKDSSTQRPSQNPGQAELYLFRVWSDINSHGTCEDGNVIGWDSEQWIFSKETLVPDASLTCSLTSTTVPPVANPSQASGSTSTAPSANTPSTTTQAVSGSGATVYNAATPSAPAVSNSTTTATNAAGTVSNTTDNPAEPLSTPAVSTAAAHSTSITTTASETTVFNSTTSTRASSTTAISPESPATQNMSDAVTPASNTTSTVSNTTASPAVSPTTPAVSTAAAHSTSITTTASETTVLNATAVPDASTSVTPINATASNYSSLSSTTAFPQNVSNSTISNTETAENLSASAMPSNTTESSAVTVATNVSTVGNGQNITVHNSTAGFLNVSTPVTPTVTATTAEDASIVTYITLPYSETVLPTLCLCNFSEFCTKTTAYYGMNIFFNSSNGNAGESQITAWLTEKFNIFACVPTNSTTNKISSFFLRGERQCDTKTETTSSLLQSIQVRCENKQQSIRTNNCTAVLELKMAADQCFLRSLLLNTTAPSLLQPTLYGAVERVGKCLCAEDSMRYSVSLLSTPTISANVCAENSSIHVPWPSAGVVWVPLNISENRVDYCTSFNTTSESASQAADQCDLSGFCNDTAAYYLVRIQAENKSLEYIRGQVNQLRTNPACGGTNLPQSPPMLPPSACAAVSIAAVLQDSYVSCQNKSTNLLSCNIIMKMSAPRNICVISETFQALMKNILTYDRDVFRLAPCNWSPQSALRLLNSSSCWVSSSLGFSEVCPENKNYSVYRPNRPETCSASESLAVLLNETCARQNNETNPTQMPDTTFLTNITTPLPTNYTTTLPNNSTNNYTTPAPANNTTKFTSSSTTTSVNSSVTNFTEPFKMTTEASTKNITTVIRPSPLLDPNTDLSSLNSSEVERLVSELENLVSGPNVSLGVGQLVVGVVSNLLNASKKALASSSQKLIRVVDTVGLKLVLDSDIKNITSKSLALAVKKIDGANFKETSFSIADPSNLQVDVRSLSSPSRVVRDVRSQTPSSTAATITLPAVLLDNLSPVQQSLVSRIQFNFYQKSTVFVDNSLVSSKLNSYILGTSVANLSLSNLKDSVVFRLRNLEPVMSGYVPRCVYWDFNQNNRSGGWSNAGCSVANFTAEETVCSCNHLTSFGVLLDLSRTGISDPVQATILTFITYIGCGISAIFLSITLLTYIAFEKVRKDIPSKILIQLCTALMLLNLVFLLDAWLALYRNAVGLCISVAFFLHYFLLVSFTWMALEAFHMYLALVKVFNIYVRRYMLKFSLIGWGVPLIIVIIVIAVNKDNYGLMSYGRFPDGSTDDFCWILNDTVFYVAVVAYFGLVFLLNLCMFIAVMVQLCRIKRKNPHNSQHRSALQDLRSAAGLTFLLGLTWGFAFFAWGPVNLAFMYLFAIFNSLQGFFIFIFHCAIKENVRKQWRMYLCCGELRQIENSEWSRTQTQKTKKRAGVAEGSFNSSNSNNISSNSSTYLVSESSDQVSGHSNPYEDVNVGTLSEPSLDVVLNDISNNRLRTKKGR
ncbi:adhesion G-protein coupled receptor G2 isoform X2 [Lepisosteus oculatus]|uniref:adhesion G-protein coupled receptor G2 isoform X2 n=1 Tax=Lepisosteus oculatus TaxID=7918 RepID=UPI0037203061